MKSVHPTVTLTSAGGDCTVAAPSSPSPSVWPGSSLRADINHNKIPLPLPWRGKMNGLIYFVDTRKLTVTPGLTSVFIYNNSTSRGDVCLQSRLEMTNCSRCNRTVQREKKKLTLKWTSVFHQVNVAIQQLLSKVKTTFTFWAPTNWNFFHRKEIPFVLHVYSILHINLFLQSITKLVF